MLKNHALQAAIDGLKFKSRVQNDSKF